MTKLLFKFFILYYVKEKINKRYNALKNNDFIYFMISFTLYFYLQNFKL